MDPMNIPSITIVLARKTPACASDPVRPRLASGVKIVVRPPDRDDQDATWTTGRTGWRRIAASPMCKKGVQDEPFLGAGG